MTILVVCAVVLVLCSACLAVSIACAVQATRYHLVLARRDRAEILALKPDPRWRGCECFVCRLVDKIKIGRGRPHAHGASEA